MAEFHYLFPCIQIQDVLTVLVKLLVTSISGQTKGNRNKERKSKKRRLSCNFLDLAYGYFLYPDVSYCCHMWQHFCFKAIREGSR